MFNAGSTVSLGGSNLVSFDSLSLEKHLKEMLVVILPCAVVRRQNKRLILSTVPLYLLQHIPSCICRHF